MQIDGIVLNECFVVQGEYSALQVEESYCITNIAL